ncbi:MAG: EamA family transporter [Nitrospiraceae bacterium]|nr:EamA family transporter [Nitrospiraceae bacterium]
MIALKGIKRDSRVKVLIALLSVYFIWGSTYLAIRIALEGFPPFMMAAIRFLTTGIGLYIFLRIRGVPAPDRSQWKGAIIVGSLLLLGGNGGVVFAEQWVACGGEDYRDRNYCNANNNCRGGTGNIWAETGLKLNKALLKDKIFHTDLRGQ